LPKKLQHQSAAFFGQDTAYNLDLMIKYIGHANSEMRTYGAKSLVISAVNQPLYPCIYQRTGAHYAWFDRRIDC
jgi:hypothetical protein